MAQHPPSYSETTKFPKSDQFASAPSDQFQSYPTSFAQTNSQYPTSPPIMMTPPSSTTNNITLVTQPGGTLIGGCPVCRVGTMSKSFTCCGICWAILCFPVGLICCLCCQKLKCNRCGAMI